ncbi:acyltransferase family protein [Flavobacterium sp.]|uniref:acyltransferase family protein n=1 Tax=Flavobacterium sp. TaxID=239 RepID=UPI0037A0C411
MKAEKDTTIETLRGAVIILVVIGHVIGSASDGGMKVNDDSFLRYLYYTFIEPIQMPLFTIIAGWVYTLRPVVYEKINDFILKKVLRVLVPMFVVGMCYFLLQYFTPGTNNKGNLLDIWKLLLFPYTLYWYLYSLFLVFVIIAFIDSFHKMNSINNWLIIFSISVFILLIRDSVIPYEQPNYLSYKGTMYLLPCFILGVGLNRFKAFFQNKLFKNFLPVILVLCIIIQQLSWFKVIDYTVHKDTIVGLLIGLIGTIMLLRFRLKTKWLIWFGGFAYSIYLFHAFGTAGGRIILKRFDIHSSILIFTVSLAAGVLLPIVAEKILERFKITRILFLGKS